MSCLRQVTRRGDFHWWNRFTEDLEIDLAREQVARAEIVAAGTVINRPPAMYRLGGGCAHLGRDSGGQCQPQGAHC
jgi:hypothetical protein